MTAIDFSMVRPARPLQPTPPVRDFLVEEFYWGYIVRGAGGAPSGILLAQSAAWFSGICFAIAAAGIWLVPTAMIDGTGGMRIAASVLFAAFSALLLWFASRGVTEEIQIDTRQGELREIARNRAGRPTLHARHGFDSIGGVFIDRDGLRSAASGRGTLVVRLGNTAQVLPVATGDLRDLEPLRDRLGRDLVVRPRQAVVNLRLPQHAPEGAVA